MDLTAPGATNPLLSTPGDRAVDGDEGPKVSETPMTTFLLLYPIAGAIIVAVFFVQCGTWDEALSAGVRSWVYGLLVTSASISCAVAHIFFGDKIVEATTGESQTGASRMLQVELATLSCLLGVALALFPDANSTAASLVASAWAAFLGIAGARHVLRGGPRAIVVYDLATCAELLVVAWVGSRS